MIVHFLAQLVQVVAEIDLQEIGIAAREAETLGNGGQKLELPRLDRLEIDRANMDALRDLIQRESAGLSRIAQSGADLVVVV